jgi:hypothetical protein
MSFSADKVPILQRSGTFSNRRFSSTKDPTENGEFRPHLQGSPHPKLT